MTKRKFEKRISRPRLDKIDATACELCLREADGYTVHHLVPRFKGGSLGPTAVLCSICHRQIHALFSEATLAGELNSIALLRINPSVKNYLR